MHDDLGSSGSADAQHLYARDQFEAIRWRTKQYLCLAPINGLFRQSEDRHRDRHALSPDRPRPLVFKFAHVGPVKITGKAALVFDRKLDNQHESPEVIRANPSCCIFLDRVLDRRGHRQHYVPGSNGETGRLCLLPRPREILIWSVLTICRRHDAPPYNLISRRRVRSGVQSETPSGSRTPLIRRDLRNFGSRFSDITAKTAESRFGRRSALVTTEAMTCPISIGYDVTPWPKRV